MQPSRKGWQLSTSTEGKKAQELVLKSGQRSEKERKGCRRREVRRSGKISLCLAAEKGSNDKDFGIGQKGSHGSEETTQDVLSIRCAKVDICNNQSLYLCSEFSALRVTPSLGVHILPPEIGIQSPIFGLIATRPHIVCVRWGNASFTCSPSNGAICRFRFGPVRDHPKPCSATERYRSPFR
jgi:hypothetical protein